VSGLHDNHPGAGSEGDDDSRRNTVANEINGRARGMVGETWSAPWPSAAPVIAASIVRRRHFQTVTLPPVPDVDVCRAPSFDPTMSLSASSSTAPLGDVSGAGAGMSHWTQREGISHRERGTATLLTGDTPHWGRC
jgi:hypothetical protein